jgi:hypothetical protein
MGLTIQALAIVAAAKQKALRIAGKQQFSAAPKEFHNLSRAGPAESRLAEDRLDNGFTRRIHRLAYFRL